MLVKWISFDFGSDKSKNAIYVIFEKEELWVIGHFSYTLIIIKHANMGKVCDTFLSEVRVLSGASPSLL